MFIYIAGAKKTEIENNNIFRDKRLYFSLSIIIILFTLFSILSYGAIEGYRKKFENAKGLKIIVPLAFSKLGYNVFADFREKELSVKPSNYLQLNESQQRKSIKGVNLKKLNLKNADMSESFLVNADLREANLCFANLAETNLANADLRETNLCFANLAETNLEHADLTHSILVGADLKEANLGYTKLDGADLTGANLVGVLIGDYQYILRAKTLYSAKLSNNHREFIMERNPNLFNKPIEK